MATWDNADGLHVRYGTSRSEVMKGGEVSGWKSKTIEHKFTYADVADTDTAAVNPHEAFIPAGAVITRAFLFVTTAFVGATAVLDIGVKQADGTNIDDDGILTTGIATIDALGDVVVGDGALVAAADLTGVRLTADAYIMTTYDTAALTAGAGTLVVEYIEAEGV